MESWIIVGCFWIYLTIAGILSKLFDNADYDAFDWLADVLWIFTIWIRWPNYYLGKPVNMDKFFLRKTI